jgi:hypothetical protein
MSSDYYDIGPFIRKSAPFLEYHLVSASLASSETDVTFYVRVFFFVHLRCRTHQSSFLVSLTIMLED